MSRPGGYIPFEIDLIKNSPGIKRPKLGVASYKVGQCEVQLSDAGAYNDHMRDIHGVKTEVRDGGYTSNLYPGLNNPSPPSQSPNGGGGIGIGIISSGSLLLCLQVPR